MITGIHFIPLRKPGGGPVSHIGIFAKIKLSHLQASDEIQQQYNIEVPISPLNLSDMPQSKNAIATSEWNDNQTTNGTNSESNNNENRFHLCQPPTITVDIHCDNT